MAENGIDKLSLSINVKDHDSAKKILQVSNAIRNLTNSLKGLDKVSEQIKSLQSVFAGVGAISRGARTGGSKKPNPKDVLKTSFFPEKPIKEGNLPFIGQGTKNQINEMTSMFQPLSESAKLVDEYQKQLKDGTTQLVEVYEEFNDGVKTTTTIVNGAVKSVKRLKERH